MARAPTQQRAPRPLDPMTKHWPQARVWKRSTSTFQAMETPAQVATGRTTANSPPQTRVFFFPFLSLSQFFFLFSLENNAPASGLDMLRSMLQTAIQRRQQSEQSDESAVPGPFRRVHAQGKPRPAITDHLYDVASASPAAAAAPPPPPPPPAGYVPPPPPLPPPPPASAKYAIS